MRQFDVVENPSQQTSRFAPFFVVLQSHLLSGVDTVVVAPLVRDATRALAGVDVTVAIEGEELVLTLAELFSLERARIKVVRGNLQTREDETRRALDRLFTGF